MEREKEQGLACAVHILGYFSSFLGPLIVYLVNSPAPRAQGVRTAHALVDKEA